MVKHTRSRLGKNLKQLIVWRAIYLGGSFFASPPPRPSADRRTDGVRLMKNIFYLAITMEFHRNVVEGIVRSLGEIFNEKKYADKVIERTFKKNPRWGSRDRRFIAETVYEIVRWWRLLQEVSGHRSLDERAMWNLVGAWLIIDKYNLPDWPEFKDIDQRKIEDKYEKAKGVRKIRESIPDWLDELGEKELRNKWDKELHALNQQAKVVLRTNTLKTSVGELQKQLAEQSVETSTLSNAPDALVLNKRQNVFQLPQFKEGLFEIQDASSQQVAYFMNVEPGMRVIDACAGAGGKTLHIATLMKNKGKVVALDVDQWKLDELKKRARRAGTFNVETKLIESGKTVKKLYESADRLLLDVPCSGLGVLKRNPDAKWKLSPRFIEEVKVKQQEVLKNYGSILKPGGMMVYATCSLLASENEKQIEKFITEQKGFELIEEKRIMPSEGFDGFYMARLKKV